MKSLQRSFAGGELTEQLFGRLDLGKFQTGLSLCRNFIVTPQGPIDNRAGFEFVRATKDNGVACLIPFTYSTDQTLVIEMGAGYFRFHTQGATVLDGSDPYEVANDYAEADLFDIHYVQSGDVLTLTHPSYPPRELRRSGATDWALVDITFVPTIDAPAAPTATGGGPGGGTPVLESYVTTAVATGTLEESLPSPADSVTIDLSEDGNYVDIEPSAVAGAIRYNVYKLVSGLYGFIGQTDGSAFRDDNIAPDVSQTPPLANDPFATGAIASVPVTAGGTGYATAPQTGGVIPNTVTVTAGGSGYTSATASASGGAGSGAAFTVNLAGDVVTSITVTNGGSLYANPTITISGDGSGATATCTASDIVDHQVTLSVTDANGEDAQLRAVVQSGAITAVQVLNGGRGYTAPVVNITEAAGGSGATFGDPVLSGTDVYPGAVAYFEQRRNFAGSDSRPQNIWMTRSGTESNMGYSIPTRDDDSITVRAAAREADTIRHLVPLGDLLALTSGGVHRIASTDNGAITPATISIKPQAFNGANNAQPIATSNAVLYAQARGGHVRELTYNWQQQGYASVDISILAPHLFDYHSIVQLAFGQAPRQVAWAVRDDGVLLGLTYAPEHDVRAWHQHTTDGLFESVAVVAEGDEDAVYVVVKRTINGSDVRYVERMHSRSFEALEDCFFVDAGLTYDGAAATTISGLDHLEGETVAVLADGGVEPPKVVSGGAITLEAAASKVHVGLPYDSDAGGMPLAIEGVQALGQGATKNINRAWLRVYQSSSIQAGPSLDKLKTVRQRDTQVPYGSPPALVTGEVPLDFAPKWQQEGRWYVRQSDPLPLTILSIALEYATGG